MSKVKKVIEFSIRPPTQDDLNFIYSTWLRGLYYGDSWYQDIPKDLFMSNYHEVVKRILSTPGVDIKIACLKDDPSVILGYSVYRSAGGLSVLDWVFVKAAWRKIGIGKALVQSHFSAVTHLTKVGKALKPPSAVFNPFLI